MDRKNGTSARDRGRREEPADLATYREFAPPPALRAFVRAFFSFTPGGAAPSRQTITREVRFARDESFCSPLFADGHASLSLSLGRSCTPGKGWTISTAPRGCVVGAQRTAGAASPGACAELLGTYFEPGAVSALIGVSAGEVTDHLVDLELIWGHGGTHLAEDLTELDEAARLDRLEAVLLRRLLRASVSRPGLDVIGLARQVRAEPASASVSRLAEAAGVSRQHLTRVFRETIGVSPKRYCRLARFQAGLAHAGAGKEPRWAELAAELGYADQSHMISEFRELSSLTPRMLVARKWFHPFILEAQSRVQNQSRRNAIF